MKKFFAIAFIAATTLVACNNSGEGEKPADTTAVPAVDTTVVAPVVDSTVKAIDSTVKAVVDSVKK
ncbi:MAG: hypothetical protein IPK57_01015 [Chitinophagaceae bacterium]|nr:hypothetical protein [Chitinophagaceae bacterium]